MRLINLFEYWTAAFACRCEIKIDALDGGQWPVAKRSVRKKQKKSDDKRAPVSRYNLIKELGH